MKLSARILSLSVLMLATTVVSAREAKDFDTVQLFKNAGESSAFFSNSYAYAVFPTIGEGGFVLGAAHGRGHVYVHGVRVGSTTMNQISGGFQAGGKAFSQIIFFADKRALDEFESGSFEFQAGLSAIAITAGASASAGTDGATASASGGKRDARTGTAGYEKGMAVFTIAKGGLMYEATLAGQKFSFHPSNSRY